MRSLAFTAVLLATVSARAQQTDVAAAEALFQEGRALLEAQRAAEACPKLAESQRLDPATGTLIALAACHELEGRLASAWAEFTEAAGRASREGRADREQLATERAAKLKPRLSTLTVVVSTSLQATPGVVFRRGGNPLGSGGFNVPVPVDGGSHLIEVTAPGKKPWRTEFVLGKENDRRTVVVPNLEPERAPSAAAPPAVERRAPEGSAKWGQLEWLGVGSAALGVATLGGSAYFLNSMLSKQKDSEQNCGRSAGFADDNDCNSEGHEDRSAAQSSGNWATGFAIAGSALLGAGGVLFFVGRSNAKQRTTVGLSLEPGWVSARVGGAF